MKIDKKKLKKRTEKLATERAKKMVPVNKEVVRRSLKRGLGKG